MTPILEDVSATLQVLELQQEDEQSDLELAAQDPNVSSATKKKRKKKKKKSGGNSQGQTTPPSIPVAKLACFTDGKFPVGELQDYIGPINEGRKGSREK
ncbi:hypothetical protein BVRB_042400, partial [Beta vulgaris subsp. vulgaris]